MTENIIEINKDFMKEINKIAAEVLGNYRRTKGTATYYIKGEVGNKKVCYTRAKTGYKGRFGFWSWVQTRYMNGKIKRTNFARSGSRKSCEKRAIKLLEKIK